MRTIYYSEDGNEYTQCWLNQYGSRKERIITVSGALIDGRKAVTPGYISESPVLVLPKITARLTTK